jgi:hypothetical protein
MAVTINGTAGITFNNSSTQAQSAGLGSSATAQTWQDLTASRASGTTYTNSTGYPIVIEVLMLISSGSPGYVVVKGGLTLTYAWPGSIAGVTPLYTCIIPNGASYSVTSNAGTTISKWYELR